MLKIITQRIDHSTWVALIDGDMMPYPARGGTEQEAVHKLKSGLDRRLCEKESECEDIRKALHVLFPKAPPMRKER